MKKLKIVQKTKINRLFLPLVLLGLISFSCSSAKDSYRNTNLNSNRNFVNIETINSVDDSFDVTIKKLNKELKKLDGLKIRVKLDNDKLKKELKEIRLHSFVDCDEIEAMVHKIQDEFKDHEFKFNFDFDLDNLNESMRKLETELKDMNIDLSNLKEEMKKLKAFLHELKSELIKDGYVKNEDEDFDLEFTKDKIVVNGERLPDNLLDKYKEIYKKHYGKEISDTFRLRNN